jgi:hypothetical protein
VGLGLGAGKKKPSINVQVVDKAPNPAEEQVHAGLFHHIMQTGAD